MQKGQNDHNFGWNAFRGPKIQICYGQLGKFPKNDKKLAKKFHFQCSKFLKNAEFPLLFQMIYGKKDPHLLYILYLLYARAVGSASGRRNAKRSAIFKKCPKRIARHFDLLYFLAQFLAKKKFPITFF